MVLASGSGNDSLYAVLFSGSNPFSRNGLSALTTSFKMIVRALAPGVQSSSTIRCKRFSCIHVHALDSLIASAVVSAFKPRCAANPIASLAPRMWIPARTWCTIFMLLPAPMPPGTRYSLLASDMASRRNRPLSRAASGAPAIIESVPFAARKAPPDTGASIK